MPNASLSINALDVVVRLMIALVLGGAIGLERERQERAAGLRTVTMVSLGSCLFTLLSMYGFGAFNADVAAGLRSDPGRVAAQIVTGIGFLGAGTIFFHRDLVRGLTTAAAIWATAAIGMAAGAGQYFAALFTTLLALVVLTVLKPIERRLFQRSQEVSVSLLIRRADNEIERVRAALGTIGVAPLSIRLHELSESEDRLEMELGLPPGRTTADLLRQIRSLEGVHQLRISRDLTEDRARGGT